MPDYASKRCTKCGEVKPGSEFGRDSKARDGLFYWCRDCSRESGRRYRESNREKLHERDRKRDRDAERERARKYREANRDAIRERERERRNAVTSPDRMCAVEGCEERRQAKGFCNMHYGRWRYNGDLGPPGRKNFPAPGECTIEGCSAVPKAKGLCDLHWSRWYRHGDPEARPFRPREGCDVTGCNRPHEARGYCSMHYGRWWRHGDPERVDSPLGDKAGYHGAHKKIYKSRGAAAGHACQHCGKRAAHWAYDHEDPGERYDAKSGRPYSHDPAHYMPLCAACHRIMDLAVTG